MNRLGKLGRLVAFDELGSGVSDALPSGSSALGPSSFMPEITEDPGERVTECQL